MNKILKKETLAPGVIRLRVAAPRISDRRQPGQFIILRAAEDGVRIPLTIADGSAKDGWIDIIFQVVGAGTTRLAELGEGDDVPDLVGPLGKPARIERFGRCLCIGGGVGVAPIYPIVRALKEAGNEVTTIIGARTADRLILVKELEALSDDFHVATEDGSLGRRGFASDAFLDLAAAGRKFDYAVVIGPAMMMKVVSAMTLERGIPTCVSLNPIMIDGTGLCGGCRLEINGETKFGCVDGPEFDAAGIDWDSFLRRLRSYRDFERRTQELEQCRLKDV
ncbi:MAG: sulfide/dihydroorotate dehydrogenase-like FAD/NAD-binding protein [Acidobacteriota bacterium]